MQILQLPTISLATKEPEEVKKRKRVLNLTGCWDKMKDCWNKWNDLFKEEDTSDIDCRGFQSILKKCVHFSNSRYRDLLMSITVMSKENTVGMYIENLQDLAVIFDQMSPYVSNFLEDCYIETEFCENVCNADWQAGEHLKVFESNSSIITESAANNEITDQNPGSGKGTGRQNR
jgi:hypothetical protein